MNEIEKKMQYGLARDKISGLVDFLTGIPGSKQGDSDLCPLTHTFSDGIYTREMLIPKGTIIVGKIHKTRHPNFILSGKVLVTNSKTDEAMEIEGPCYFVSDPGLQKVVYAVEDTRWITIHRTDSEDLEAIEEEVIAKSYEELPDNIKKEILLCPGE
jgi:hypothetical protein